MDSEAFVRGDVVETTAHVLGVGPAGARGTVHKAKPAPGGQVVTVVWSGGTDSAVDELGSRWLRKVGAR